jgi:leader peptidase (prepilin peptidase)/N-methyltransferase
LATKTKLWDEGRVDDLQDRGALGLLLAPSFGYLFAALWGALWGSFFNVCIHRIGLYESVTRPRSRCPHCGRTVRALENIPLLSWLLLRGRCRGCRVPISVRYPIIEALSLLLGLAVYLRFVVGAPDDPVVLLARFLVYFAFLGTLLVLCGIDLDHLIIPDRVTYPAIPIFLVCGLVLRDVPLLSLLLGPVVGYLLVAVTAELAYLILRREGMGYGDAKLLALVGALLGWKGALFVFFVAPFVGLLVLVPLTFVRRGRLFGVEIPYGPFLAIAAAIYLFFGPALLTAMGLVA